jgi:hypothetical protein
MTRRLHRLKVRTVPCAVPSRLLQHPLVFDDGIILDRLVPEYSQTLAQTVGSPPGKASSWLKSDGGGLFQFQALQRFALATTLFIQQRGADWVNNGLAGFNQTECDWYSRRGGGPCSDAGQITLSIVLLDNGMAGTTDELAISLIF